MQDMLHGVGCGALGAAQDGMCHSGHTMWDAGRQEGWWGWRGCPPPPGQAGLLDKGHLALSPQAVDGGRTQCTGYPHSMCPSCKSCPRSQPAASQSKGQHGMHPWRCSGVSSCPGSSSPLPSHPDASLAFHSPRQHWGLLPFLFHDPRTSPGSWLPCRCHISPSRACPPQLPLLMAWFLCELGASQPCLA